MRAKRPSADKTRTKILKAAKRCFLRNGYAGTSTQLIADTAKVNQNLLFHHFKNKKNLWREIKMLVIKTEFVSHPIDDSSLESFIRSIVEQRINIYYNHPDLVQMMRWQQLETRADEISGATTPIVFSWIEPIEKLKECREISEEIDTKIILVMLATWVNGVFMQNIIQLNHEQIMQYEVVLIKSMLAVLAVE